MAPKSDSDAPQSTDLVLYADLAKHNTSDSLWVLVDDTVYDITSILDSHPGGSGPLLRWAGKDATKAFRPIHPPGTLDTLPSGAVRGKIDPASVPQDAKTVSAEEQRIQRARAALPQPASVLNLHEVEALVETVLSATAWGYYRSAGDDERTFDENRAEYGRWWFRPRVLRRISHADPRCVVFGHPSTLPIFIAPAALARLGHPDGEMNLVRAAGKEGIVQGISNNASCSTAEIMSAWQPGQHLLFQLYVNRNRAATEELVKGLRGSGYGGLILTVDAAVPGNRERDRRAQGAFTGPANGAPGPRSTSAGGGVAQAISGYQDPDVVWDDIPWLQRLTDLPFYVKGIQCVEDAVMALEEYKVQGVILSNHGGRSLDYSPPPISVLHELRLARPDLVQNREIYVDGGVTRGTDVLKALCLGARGVGLGRAFLYGNALWGEAGCRRVIEIMRDEIVTGMRLMGVQRLEELRPEMVRFVGDAPRARM